VERENLEATGSVQGWGDYVRTYQRETFYLSSGFSLKIAKALRHLLANNVHVHILKMSEQFLCAKSIALRYKRRPLGNFNEAFC
jgi:hypothetical protein